MGWRPDSTNRRHHPMTAPLPPPSKTRAWVCAPGVLKVIVCPLTSPVAGETKALNTSPAGKVSVKTML